MKLNYLICSCVAGMLLFSAQSRADIVTFSLLDSIPDEVPSYTDHSSFLMLSLFGASSSTGNIANRAGNTGESGLTFDFPFSGVADMWAVNATFDRDVTIVGYSVSVSSGEFASGAQTFTFGSTTGLSAVAGNYTLATPIDLAGGNSLNISETSMSNTGTGFAVISSITVEAVPEPSTFAFLGLGGLALASRRRRRI